MKSLSALLPALAIAFTCSLSVPLKAQDKPGALAGESLGQITLGQKSEEVLKLLGKPGSKGKDTLWAATGDWVQEWRFPAQGFELAMASVKQGGAKTVSSVTGSATCKLATKRGIKVGSTEAAVRNAYGDVENKEDGHAGQTFVAGSIYGGVIFTLKGGKVSEIFIGAAAE